MTVGLRLADGGNVAHQGRVEVFYNGTWGTVCDHYWDFEDATVACRHLGFEGAVKEVKYASFGRGKGIIWMDYVRCTGDESLLTECYHTGWGKSYCSHSRDAGVICTPGNYSIHLTF